jgi:ribosomal protein S18 acetylase RimI-like enzyme
MGGPREASGVSDLVIRRATPADAPFLAWISLAAARSHLPRGFWDLFAGDDTDRRRALLEQLLLADEPSWWHWSGFWIAEHEGRPGAALSGFDPARLAAPDLAVHAAARAAGFDRAALGEAFARCTPMFSCMHEPSRGAWIVESDATRPEARGAGLGAALVEHVVAEGRGHGHAQAELSLMIGNEPAQRLYERHGFAISAEKRSEGFEAALGCPGIAKMTRRL